MHEGDARLCLSLLILVFGSLFSGYLLRDLFVGFGSVFFDNSIFILSHNAVGFDIE
jgi:NADH-ubiquinone oxidoreductase chain 5